ncbi:MAG TPA: AIR synthase related protein, partial [Pyrinomonadaceae bacterium]|nr:AIR synthase related protein [Pyrinomonadaceae bacterium]
MSDEWTDARHGRRARSSRIKTDGEFDFIESLRRRVSRRSSLIAHRSSLIHGIGDDAAVVRFRGDAVVTADLLVEDVDFRLRTAEPDALGHKALAVSLSDIAAMGARPRWALLSVGVPPKIWNSSFLDQFYEGFFRLAREHGVALVSVGLPRDVWETDFLDEFYAGLLALARRHGVALVGGDVS